MYFRPLPILTLIAIPALAALVALGMWQWQRAGWKAEEIADFQTRMDAPPRPFAAVCDPSNDPLGLVLAARSVLGSQPARADETPAIKMFGQSSAGGAGWLVLEAFPAPECMGADAPPVVAQSGFVPMTPEGSADGAAAPTPDRYIVTPWPPRPAFAPDNSPETNDWHWFDAAAMASAFGRQQINTSFYLKDFDGELPAHLARTPPATHIGYAVTWFGMAIGFVVIYALFHARAGRLRFGRNKTPGGGKA